MNRPRLPLWGLPALVVLTWACEAPAPPEGSGPSASDDASAAAEPDPSAAEGAGSSGDPQAAPEDLLAAHGIFDDSIVFGQSAAFSGDPAGLGINMRLGIRAAFDEANRAGGIHGRELKLIWEDDRYEPELAVEKTRMLIHHGIFGLIGAVGTPTSARAEPIASESRVPYIGAFTGAGLLRRENQRYVVNLRASYDQETEEMVERLTTDLNFSRIAILYQDDSYGYAGLSGVRKALERRNMALVGEGTYVRNTLAVKRAALNLRESNPQAVIIIGAYRPAAEFIRWARKLGMRTTVYVNISFVGSNNLLRELGWSGEGVVVTQVVPFPLDADIPVVVQYRDALERHDSSAQPGFISLEGYLVGRLVVEVLRRAADPDGAPPTRESFLQTLAEAGPIDLGGFVVEYGLRDNQGSEAVFLTVIRDGQFVPVSELSR